MALGALFLTKPFLPKAGIFWTADQRPPPPAPQLVHGRLCVLGEGSGSVSVGRADICSPPVPTHWVTLSRVLPGTASLVTDLHLDLPEFLKGTHSLPDCVLICSCFYSADSFGVPPLCWVGKTPKYFGKKHEYVYVCMCADTLTHTHTHTVCVDLSSTVMDVGAECWSVECPNKLRIRVIL